MDMDNEKFYIILVKMKSDFLRPSFSLSLDFIQVQVIHLISVVLRMATP